MPADLLGRVFDRPKRTGVCVRSTYVHDMIPCALPIVLRLGVSNDLVGKTQGCLTNTMRHCCTTTRRCCRGFHSSLMDSLPSRGHHNTHILCCLRVTLAFHGYLECKPTALPCAWGVFFVLMSHQPGCSTEDAGAAQCAEGLVVTRERNLE